MQTDFDQVLHRIFGSSFWKGVNAEACSEPCQTPKMGLLAVNYFRKTLYLRCLAGFWIRLSNVTLRFQKLLRLC